MSLTTLLISDVRDTAKARIGIIFTHGAIGNDDTTPTPADTTLENEQFRSAIDDFDSSAANTAVAQLQIGLSENNGNDIKEVGWFNDLTTGTMWIRNIINTITKTSDIRVFLDTQITFSISEDLT